MQPHLHLLVPEGAWSGGVFLEMPRPTQEELEAVLARMLAQARRTFEALNAPWPEDAFEALQPNGNRPLVDDRRGRVGDAGG